MQQFIYSKDDLSGILLNLITTGDKWEGHKHTVAVAEFWSKIISGKNHNDIILALRPNETGEQKQQKIRLYNSRTKSVANKIISQIKEVYRSDNIFNEIYFTEKKDNNTDLVKKIQSSLNNFSGKKNVRQWLRERYLRLNIIDPNAFIVTNFTGTGQYYPIEVRSKDVLSRQYVNGTLQYLAFVEEGIEKIVIDGKTKTAKSFKYWIFGDTHAILFHKVPKGATGIGTTIAVKQSPDAYTTDNTTYTWSYAEYEINAGQVPAWCVGYVPDPENDDKTFESIMYPAKELFIELIWRKMSYDIHMVLHGIAQKFAFVPACDFKDKALGLECKQGVLTNGKQCEQCHGTGQMPFHTSESDIITLSLPKDTEKIFDLSKMIYYQPIPIEIINMTKEEVRDAEMNIPLAVFNRSIVDKGALVNAETATKIRDDKNSINNTLYEFSLSDADFYKNIVTQIAIYGNNWREDLVIDYSYPNDFNLESVNDLFAQSKDAIISGSPAIVRSKINGKIISKLCIDNKSAIHNYDTREYWRPFTDPGQLAMVPELDRSRILYIYFDQIFRDLEEAMYTNDGLNIENKEIPFSSLPREKQKILIDEQIDLFIDQYTAAKNTTPAIKVPRATIMNHTEPTYTDNNPDKNFAKMMIPHHQDAIDMANMELKNGKDVALKEMAKNIIKNQSAEIEKLKQYV